MFCNYTIVRLPPLSLTCLHEWQNNHLSLSKGSYFSMTQAKDLRFNPKNERMKYKYRVHLKRIGRKDDKTMVEELKHLRGYEVYTSFQDFALFNEEVADKY